MFLNFYTRVFYKLFTFSGLLLPSFISLRTRFFFNTVLIVFHSVESKAERSFRHSALFFSFFLLSFFLKLDITFLNERVHFLILSLYMVL